MKKINPFAVFFVFSLIFFCTTLCFKNKSDYKPQDVCFVNGEFGPDCKDVLLDSFAVKVDGEELSFFKEKDYWFVYEGDNRNFTSADPKIVKSLINILRNNHKLYKISDKKSFNSENKGKSIWFYDKKNQISRELYFGKSSPITDSIIISVEDNGVFEAKDVFSSFLNCDINYWAQGEIFGEIVTPVNNSELIKYRHGKITDDRVDGLKLSFECSVTDESGRIVTADFYKKDESTYLLKKKVIPSKWDDEQLVRAFKSTENTVYEVSGWTFDKIKNIANKSRL